MWWTQGFYILGLLLFFCRHIKFHLLCSLWVMHYFKKFVVSITYVPFFLHWSLVTCPTPTSTSTPSCPYPQPHPHPFPLLPQAFKATTDNYQRHINLSTHLYIKNLAQECSYYLKSHNHDPPGNCFFCSDGQLAECCSIFTIFQWDLRLCRTIYWKCILKL